ncbi:50S ribosomal protein L17 [uncultured Amnibacterium sp.]|uniref:50S ribosomal protein L17 n=1 Tax=uncultured Amnibacterium sp. TaxID=1631851 RepID=UPI0035CBD629
MPKPTKGPRLGGGPAHERLMLANLTAQLFTYKSIQTTEAKAKRMRPLAERMVTFAKRGDLHARRRVLSTITDKGVVHELFTEIAPQVQDRQGGYTRITKTGFRKGDNAPMAVIELVLEPVTPKRAAPARARRATPAAAAPTEPETIAPEPGETPAADEVPVEDSETLEVSEEVSDGTPAESATPAAEEVEADAAETAAGTEAPEAPTADEPKPDDDAPPTVTN